MDNNDNKKDENLSSEVSESGKKSFGSFRKLTSAELIALIIVASPSNTPAGACY